MATYIQGITDYIPKLQPFQPDFNFFQKTLEAKQQQYDAGYNKISALYGDLLNSDLLRQPNVDRRNEFFTDVDNEIKRLSGVDLSLQENVQQAKSVFQPLIDNQYFRKDLVFTKSYRKAKAKGENLRNKPDPKSEVKWWAEGDRALDYQAEDFSKSSDEESLGYSSNLRYVPAVDVISKLYAFGKENDINPDALTRSGGYLITTTNGMQAVPKLQSVFSNVLASDPRVKEMFATQAYLDRKNYMKSNAEKFQGDELAAETEYLKTKVNDINAFYRKANAEATVEKDQANTKKKAIESTIKKQGIDPDLDQGLVEMYQGALSDQQVTSANADRTTEVLAQTDFMDFDGMDRQSLRYRVDNAMSYFLMDDMASKTAVDYALSKEKIKDIQVDQYALEAVKFKYASALEDKRFDHEKILKIVDIVGEMMKNSGKSVPGSDPTGMSLSINGMRIPIPGAGNVSTQELDVQERNAAAISNVEQADENAVKRNMELFLTKQNAVLTSTTATQAEKDLAKQEIEKTLGVYSEKKEAAYSYEKEKPVEWGKGLAGAGKIVGGGVVLGLSAMVEGLSFGAATPVAGLGIIGGAGLAASGAGDFMEGFNPKETVNVPETTVGTSGYAQLQPDGSYKLVFNNKDLKNPNSNDYYTKVNDRINVHNWAMKPLDMKNPDISMANYIAAIDANNGEINGNKLLLETQKEILVDNNKKIAAALAGEADVDAWHSEYFFTPDKTRPKTEEEFVSSYIEAHKDDYTYYPKEESVNDYWIAKTTVDRTDEDRYAKMREDALDMYDDLKDGYETLSKNPEAILGLRSFDPTIMSLGANRLMGEAAMYSWDAVNYGDSGYKMLMEAYMKDMKPAMDSEAFRNQSGVKFMYGNGFNITADDYEEADNSAGAARILNFALASALTNQGGKANEKTDRPKGMVYYHTVAANDGNKMAATVELSEEMVKANAGSKENPGPTWELSEKLAKGEIASPQITFFIDADKVKSTPFLAAQSTKEEFLLENGKLALDYQYGGNIKYTKNAIGGISYSGYAQSVNELGQLVQNPVFGTLLGGENINSVYRTHHDMFQQISQTNLAFMQDMSMNNPNAIKDPAALQQILQGQ